MKKETLLSALLKSAGCVLLFIGLQRFASFVAQFVLSISLLVQKIPAEELGVALESAFYHRMYETMVLSELLFFGAVLLFHRKQTLPLGGIRKPSAKASVWAGVFLGFGAFVVTIQILGYLALIPAVQESAQDYEAMEETIAAANPSLFFEILSVGLIGPFAEELLCRGLIQNRLMRVMRPLWAISLAAAVFSLVHGNLYQIVFTFPLGLLMGYVAYRFDSLWPAVALHCSFNLSNYWIRLGDLFGLAEDSAGWMAVFAGCYLFLVLCIPIGLLLLSVATRQDPRKKPAPAGIPPVGIPPLAFSETNPPAVNQTAERTEGDPMAAPEFLVVGLGNPGEKYAATRHNCGFIALDYMAARLQISMNQLRFRALTGEATVNGKKVLFLKPQTFMNLSGESVAQAAAYYKIPPKNILVIYDDINFRPGSFRIRESGSAGGHNGIKSILAHLGSDAFCRVKMGIGQPPEGWELMNWVLSRFDAEDEKKLLSCMEDVFSTLRFFTLGETARAMQNFNGKDRNEG